MNKTKFLLRTSAIYAVIGVFMGGHMAGAGSYMFRAIHAHILVVGWLSLFAFAVFYALFAIPKKSKLATVQVWSAVFGSFGLTAGMWMYYFQPAWAPELFNLIFYIAGGSVLMISFFAFLILTFVYGKQLTDKQ
ncbi:hypothetical protein [Alkalihalobacterium chitinilyticum]|uniref:Cytochrome-c oxidase n=1 Tax=Alkalihalobacterium chitinilyticum TaxID=2980103 RepID=A0ABT5VDR1_9BACI|nr:hypothetical protein [Alkalihalobacterium chitinilyticum]MDE5413400.1 hypothetical protein [Alkalihalobacterium chitinilyticum]